MLLGLFSHYFFGITIFLTSSFLIMLVLVQRGRGGGIAGALGGAGGQSAFGTKAGDLFTRITVGVATFWILLSCAAILTLKERTFSTGVDEQQAKSGAASAPAGTGGSAIPGAPAVEGIGGSNSASSTPESSPASSSGPAAATQPADQSAEAAAAQPSTTASPEVTGDVPDSASAGEAIEEKVELPSGDLPPSGQPQEVDQVSPEVSQLDSASATNTPDE